MQKDAAPTAGPQSIPAPYSGWNTRDALDAMDPTDAVVMDNWYPNAGGVELRNGFAPFASGMGSQPVQTLAQFTSGLHSKLIAAASGNIYDASGGGVISGTLGSGFANNQWQTAQFLQRLFLVNGADPAQIYDGTTLSAASFTGVSTSTLYGVWLYQNRLFFWQKNSTGFWYAQLNSLSGALAFYDLSAFTALGGNLVAVTTTSYDGGNGVTDFIVFIMSTGEMLLYSGNDPSQSSFWQLVGIYRVSPPLGPRAICNYGAEGFITTFDDHMQIEQVLTYLRLGQLPPRTKVANAVQAAALNGNDLFGWQALYYPAGRRLIFNIPNPDGSFDQHVCNTGGSPVSQAAAIQQTGLPWCRFTNMPAQCWGLYENNLYFGSLAGTIYQADTGSLDNLGPIIGDVQQAWNDFQLPNRKAVKAVRPILSSSGSITYNFGLGYDFNPINTAIAAVTQDQGTPWDISPWGSPWSPEPQVDSRWRIGSGTGQSVSMRLRVTSTKPIQWLRTDFRAEIGSAL